MQNTRTRRRGRWTPAEQCTHQSNKVHDELHGAGVVQLNHVVIDEAVQDGRQHTQRHQIHGHFGQKVAAGVVEAARALTEEGVLLQYRARNTSCKVQRETS